MNGTVKLLVVDHDAATLEKIAAAWAPDEVRLFSASDAESGLEVARREQPQIALIDPATAGMDLLDRLLEIDPGMTVFIVTAQYAVDSAVDAIRRGAHDYLSKPLSRRANAAADREMAGGGRGTSAARCNSISSLCGRISSKAWWAAAR